MNSEWRYIVCDQINKSKVVDALVSSKNHNNDWIFVDDRMPEEDEYILGCSGEDSPIFITRFHDGEWDTGANGKRPCYHDNIMYKTSADPVYWMPIPKPPGKR